MCKWNIYVSICLCTAFKFHCFLLVCIDFGSKWMHAKFIKSTEKTLELCVKARSRHCLLAMRPFIFHYFYCQIWMNWTFLLSFNCAFIGFPCEIDKTVYLNIGKHKRIENQDFHGFLIKIISVFSYFHRFLIEQSSPGGSSAQ